MARVDREIRAVPVLESPSPDEWRRWRATSRAPCVLRGIGDMGRVRQWTRDYLATVAGHRQVPVEYTVRRITRLDARVYAGHHMRRSMSFADALAAIETTPLRGVTHYVSTVELARWLPELQEDVVLPGILDAPRSLGAYLFAGGDGTGSALHYDPTDNYVLVLQGSKEVLLFPPGRLHDFDVTPVWLPYSGVSRMNPERLHAYALQRPNACRCVTGPFDLLYIPQNWWHAVTNRGVTIGLSFSFDWSARSLLRWRQSRLCLRLHLDRWLTHHPAAAARVERWVESVGWSRAKRRTLNPRTSKRRPAPPTAAPR